MVNGIGNFNNPYGGFIVYNPNQTAADLYRQKRRELFIENHEKEKKSSAFTKAVATTAVIAGIGGVILAKGGTGKFYNYLNKLVQKADNMIYRYQTKTKAKIPLNIFQKTSLVFFKSYKFLLEKANAINNFTGFKDSGFMRLAEKWHFKGLCDASTRWFKQISINGSRSYHLTARKTVDSHCEALRQITNSLNSNPNEIIKINGISQAASEWAKSVNKLLNGMENNYIEASSTGKRNERIARIDKSVEGLRQKVFNEIFNKKVLTDNPAKFRLYRTEALSAEGKKAFSDEIITLRRKFCNDIDDNYNVMSNATAAIRNIIRTSDDEALNISRKLAEHIDNYKSFKGPDEKERRKEITKLIKSEISKLEQAFKKKKYSDTSISLFKNKVAEMNFVLDHARKGRAEEITTILRRCLNQKEYEKATKIMDKMTESVKKAYEQELLLYEKIAELEVGSAPTDVLLGVILPVGWSAYAIAQGENKDEKIAASLKAGVPIIGGILTSLYCTASMMNNMKSIIFGGVTGIGLNLLGTKANDKYIEYKKNKALSQKAIAEYRKKFQ